MKEKHVSYTFQTLPPRTEADRLRLQSLADRPDSEIDFTDIPELNDEQLERAQRSRLAHSAQQQVTTPIDADVLAWLKSQGKDYQTRINAILRRAMLASTKQP